MSARNRMAMGMNREVEDGNEILLEREGMDRGMEMTVSKVGRSE